LAVLGPWTPEARALPLSYIPTSLRIFEEAASVT
jgi:hypothetical protein